MADLQYLFDSVTPGYVEPKEPEEGEEEIPVPGISKKKEVSQVCVSPQVLPPPVSRSSPLSPCFLICVLIAFSPPHLPLQCLFSVDIEFHEPESIEFSPSGHEFALRIDATINDFVGMLKTVGSLITHEAFKRYTQPVINGRQDSADINEGFDIVGLIEDNDDYNRVVDGIKNSFDLHFDQVIEYVKVLEPHKKIYMANEALDMATHAEATLEEWKELMDEFIAQSKLFEAIPLSATVGIFGGNNQRIKDLFLPSPKRCLDDIHRMLPQLTASLCQKLLAETSHASDRLSRNPEDVAEFVEYSEFLRTTNERQKEFMERGAMINNM